VNSSGQSSSVLSYTASTSREKFDRYYRLRHYDTDGFSAVVSGHTFVKGFVDDAIQIRCNKNRNECYIMGELPEDMISLEVVNALGKSLSLAHFLNEQKSVEIDLPEESGVYMLVLRNSSGEVIHSDKVVFINQ
jgi:hypothetical protein